MAMSNLELGGILDSKKDAPNKWCFLCRWRGYRQEEDIHGYADTFIKLLKKNHEIDRESSLPKHCVTNEDLQDEEYASIVARPICDKM